MKSPANRMKDQSSAIKRVATTLRNTAKETTIGETDRKKLISAAMVMEKIGNKTAATAKTKAREEAAFEKAHRTALQKLNDHLKCVSLKTTGDKVRAALMDPYISCVTNALKQKTLRELERELSYYAQDGIEERARHHAYHIAKGQYNLKTAIDAINKRIADLSACAEAMSLSTRFVNAIEKLKEAETNQEQKQCN